MLTDTALLVQWLQEYVAHLSALFQELNVCFQDGICLSLLRYAVQ